MQSPTYRERLWAPVGYWLIGLFFGLTLVVALGVYLGMAVGIATLVSVVVLITGGLLWYGGTAIVVGERELQVGRRRIPYGDLGRALALDPEATRRRLGVEADVQAELVQRPYIRAAVELPVTDVRDPHPYWLVSSRHPAQFAAAVNARRDAGLSPDPTARQDEPESTKE